MIFSCALLTMLWRLMTKHALATASASRCKRYQLVCGILRSSSEAFRARSIMISVKFPSRKSRSAALTASNAFRQRIQSKFRNAELSDEAGSNESEPSISAMKYWSHCADRASAWMSEALPALARGEITSVIALLGKPPPVIRSRNWRPVGRVVVEGCDGWGKRSASALRRSIMAAAVAMPESWH